MKSGTCTRKIDQLFEGNIALFRVLTKSSKPLALDFHLIGCIAFVLLPKNCNLDEILTWFNLSNTSSTLTQICVVHFPSALPLVSCNIQRGISEALANDYTPPHLKIQIIYYHKLQHIYRSSSELGV